MRLIRTLLPMLMLLFAANRAEAWWDGNWPYRMKVTADASAKGANIAEPVGRTQILLRLHSGNFNFQTVKEGGEDLRIVAADDKTPLKFHIERFDGLIDQVGLVWIDIPDLAPGAATGFYVYWGNKDAASGSDQKATYDGDQVLVYHFGETDGLPKDTTAAGLNAASGGKRDDGGMVGFGLRLDGTAPVKLPALPLPASASATWSMWVRANDTAKTGVLFGQREGATALTIGLADNVAYAALENAGITVRTPPGQALGDGWHHVAVTAGGGNLTVFVDGTPRGQVAAALPALAGTALLGGAPPADAAPAPPPAVTPGATAAAPVPGVVTVPAFSGVLDEFQVSRIARPTGAFQAAVHSQGPTANLLTLDPPEEASAFGTGYFAIILKSVTVDAWVVITILMIMALMSWIVMVMKSRYVGRTAKADRLFRRIFEEASTKALEEGTGFARIDTERNRKLRDSSLLRLYRIAERELAVRVAAGRVAGDGRLAPQSLSAIRSTVDSGLAKEQTRLQRMIVLLTICIAGGPFLGLLGTVVGVMIVFAAIAAAGDVNVNAIAPGVSAALLATVTGLFVAIPALFGYNYLLTRIRDITVDMTTFTDEMITRMGETPQAVPHRMAAE